MDVKLVDYSESSSSGEEHKQTESKKIAIVQPVPQDKLHQNSLVNISQNINMKKPDHHPPNPLKTQIYQLK